MQRIGEVIKQNVLWVMVGLLVVAFMVIATQSKGQVEEQDLAFINADPDGRMHKGDKVAPVNIVVYTDFLCPYCSQFANDVMPLIETNYIETGKAQIEVRPVAMIGLDSDIAAEAAFCAADQDQFWPFHDELYSYVEREIVDSGANTREDSVLSASIMADLMKDDAGFDDTQFKSCLADKTYAETVKSATDKSMANGVNGTPYVMVDGNHIQGPTYDIMSSVIKAQL